MLFRPGVQTLEARNRLLSRSIKVVRPLEPYCGCPSLEPLRSVGSQFPGLAAYVIYDSNEVGGRVFTSPRGERSLLDLGLGFETISAWHSDA